MMAVFEKGQRLRHIGHLDIQRAMQRALRRSGLPVAYYKLTLSASYGYH